MKVIFNFYGNPISVTEIGDSDFRNIIDNGYISINNNTYRVIRINIDILSDETIIDVIRKFSFSHCIYYPNYNKEIISELNRLGYVESNVAGKGKHLFTNANEGLYYFTNNDYSNGGMGYVCGNVLEARDIAAIQNDNDINQLFKFANNEAEYCTCFSSVEEWNDREDSTCPHKMTPEEIIEYYKTFEIPNFYA